MKHKHLVVALGAALSVTFAASAFASGPDKNRYIVTIKPGSAANVEHAAKAAGGKVHLRITGTDAIALSVPEQALKGLRNNPNVISIEADAVRYPMAQVSPYGIAQVQAPDAVAISADGSGIKVCIIDSGIKSDHEDFAGVAMTGQSGQNWGDDSCGHGTHVAGTIAAANNNLGVVGVSPGKVSLHIVKVFDGSSCGWSYSSSLINAANECANAGAKIISMSLGGGSSSTTESNGFANLYSQGILSIAAAGNAGNTTKSYPASYDSVMSVAATDSANALASFSQRNDQVEISAPGVGILSTYPLRDAAVTVNGASFIASALDASVQGSSSGALVDGGRCTSAGSWSGKTVLCERGDITFADKASNAANGGATGVIIYNNVSGGFGGSGASSIPAVTISQEDGQQLLGSLGQNAFVSTVSETDANGYAYLDGTSMATPHVSGVAALVWSAKPTATAAEVRAAMTSTALDLGSAGRDTSFGYGLVQAFDAIDALVNGGGGGGGGGEEPPPADAPSDLSVSGSFAKGKYRMNLAWSAGASTVDIFRNGSKIRSAVSNSGSYSEQLKLRGSGTLSYQVCNAGTTTCSNTASINY
ncbi:MAG TPA: S8 family serine peptidase [Arenimonas sp.]|nr:S8 family serine peptidase [Arenimonas sp.]